MQITWDVKYNLHIFSYNLIRGPEPDRTIHVWRCLIIKKPTASITINVRSFLTLLKEVWERSVVLLLGLEHKHRSRVSSQRHFSCLAWKKTNKQTHQSRPPVSRQTRNIWTTSRWRSPLIRQRWSASSAWWNGGCSSSCSAGFKIVIRGCTLNAHTKKGYVHQQGQLQLQILTNVITEQPWARLILDFSGLIPVYGLIFSSIFIPLTCSQWKHNVTFCCCSLWWFLLAAGKFWC